MYGSSKRAALSDECLALCLVISISVIMGSCVSKSNKRPRSRKYSVRFRKYHGKISASVPDAPTTRKSDVGDPFARSQIVHVKTAASCRKTEVSNLAFHLTELQWHHNQTETNGVWNFFQIVSSSTDF